LVAMRVSELKSVLSGPGVGEPVRYEKATERGYSMSRWRVSAPCGYQRRESGTREPCKQPIVLVLNINTTDANGALMPADDFYTFPPDWHTANTTPDEELIEKYRSGRVPRQY
jgi:hypothetical protein